MSNIQNGNWVASMNPLHADYGVSEVQQIRGEQRKVEFRPSRREGLSLDIGGFGCVDQDEPSDPLNIRRNMLDPSGLDR